MYEAHFGLRARPFRPGVDPAVYYPAGPHEQIVQSSRSALADQEPFVLLTGEPGLGKTLLAQVMLERIGDEAACAVITNSHLDTRVALLQALLFDLGLPYESKSEQELRLTLTDCLLGRLRDDQRTIFLIDEAHHLPADGLEELRLMANLESPQGRALQIVLIGLPELLETLRQAPLRALNQRLTTRLSLGPLDFSESADYVLHQLRWAGARPDAVIEEEALELLAKASQGVPRLLNQSAHQALVVAYQAGAGRVDAEAVIEALNNLGIELPTDASEPVTVTEAVKGRSGAISSPSADGNWSRGAGENNDHHRPLTPSLPRSLCAPAR
jgi:type II secretory pathway predicted ATPase ExeA